MRKYGGRNFLLTRFILVSLALGPSNAHQSLPIGLFLVLIALEQIVHGGKVQQQGEQAEDRDDEGPAIEVEVAFLPLAVHYDERDEAGDENDEVDNKEEVRLAFLPAERLLVHFTALRRFDSVHELQFVPYTLLDAVKCALFRSVLTRCA